MNSVSTRATTDDAALVAASCAGGIDAFGRLVERYQSLVCAVAYSKTGDRLLSEDIGQETFLTAWNKLDTVQEPDKLRSWLCSIARNLSSKAVRVRKRERLSDSETLDRNADATLGPLASAINKERESTVWQALEDLPDNYREPLVLFYREDKSIKQVALGLGLSEDTAKQRLSRGRQALKEGVSNLVEQTLQSSRPSKAFTAAVLGLVGAVAAPGSAAAAQTAAANSSASAGSSAVLGSSKLLWAGLAVAALLALVVGVVVTRSSGSTSGSQVPGTSENDNTAEKPDRAILAALHTRRTTATADTPAISCEFHGKVIGSGGEVILGASVAITKDSKQSDVLDPSAVNTNADGSWHYGPVPRGAYLVSITAPGHLPQTRMEQCDKSDDHTIETPLAIGGTRLHGTIADIGGGPVSDVTVWLIPPLGQTGGAITTKTNDDGVYDLSVHPDRYMMLTVHPDYVLDARPVLVSGESAQEDFVVLPGAVIEGKVTNERGEPIVGAKVSTGGLSFRNIHRTEWAFSSLFGALFPVETDDQGRYRLTGLPPGVAQIHARTPKLVTRDPAEAHLAIAESETGVDVVVTEVFKVSGFVVHDDNPREGMANVNVLVQPEGTVTTPNFATTDDSGYFEVAGLVPNSYRIFAAGGTAAPLVMDEVVTISDADIEDVLIRAKIGNVVRGQIVPSGRASVRLEPASYGQDIAGALRYAATSMARVEVDETGVFRFPSVADGEYVVVASTIDGEGRTSVSVAGGEVEGLSINITTLAKIEGRVVDDRGAAVVGALVEAKPKKAALNTYTAQLHTRDRTDREGRFEIIGLLPSTYELRVFDHKGQREWANPEDADAAFEPQMVEVSGGTTNAALSVTSKGRSVRGVVVGLDKSPVKDAWVEVRASSSRHAPVGHKQMPVLTDGDGNFELRGLFGESFEVEATGPRGKLQTASVKTTGEAPITLTLSTLSTVLATVKRDGKRVADFEVEVSEGPSRVIGRMVEKKDGSFELPRLLSGEYKIEVKSGDSYVQKLISVGPAPTTSIELQLQPTSSIRGRIIDESESPLRGAKIIVFGVGLRIDRVVKPAGTEVQDDGSFEIAGLAAGRGSILVRSDDEDDAITFLEFELKPGEDLDLGTIQRGKRQSLADAPYMDTSADLGIRFFAGPKRPTAGQLEQIDQSDNPRSLLETDEAQLWIAIVEEGSAAEQAGLRRGDSVLSVGQMQIGEALPPSEAMISLSQRWRSKGRSVDWVVKRSGRQLNLPVLVPR